MRISIDALRKLVDTRYDGNVSAAAQKWGLEQSHLCRTLNAERTLKPSVLRRIAKIEHVNHRSLVEAQHPKPALKALVRDIGPAARFVYDVDDPGSMLLQMENWFADVPNKDGMRTHLVRALMRNLFDHSFDQVHQPTPQWRAAMDHMDGWTYPAARAKRPNRVW